jgi:hypothetical protein
MDILVSTRGHPKEANVPYSSQYEPNDNNASRECSIGAKFTNGEEIRDAGERQSGHEVRSACKAEVS